ncbi:hypothetical protein MASR1M31_12830 [Porphyromonadaceae bacterium]
MGWAESGPKIFLGKDKQQTKREIKYSIDNGCGLPLPPEYTKKIRHHKGCDKYGREQFEIKGFHNYTI